jgi:hypothetical protein
MLKKIWVLILLAFATECNAWEIECTYHTKGKVHLCNDLGRINLIYKLKMLAYLSDSIFKAKNYKGEDIFIVAVPAFTWAPTRYGVSFGSFTYYDENIDFDKNSQVTTKGLRIYIRDWDFDLRKLLNLVNAASSNLQLVKANQSESFAEKKTQFSDPYMSVPPAMVSKFMSSTDTVIEQLLSKKFYLNNNESEIGEIDYYFQNNSYHIYRYLDRKKNSSSYGFTEKEGQDLLTVNTVREIFSPLKSTLIHEDFIFPNDSVFYFISSNDEVKGPFIISNLGRMRRHISQYRYEDYNLRRYVFHIDDNTRFGKTVLFFPDSNLLISNFRMIEDSFYNQFFKKTEQIIEGESKDDNFRWALNVIMLISIGLNIWFFWKRRN